MRRQWPPRENMVAGEKNIITEPLFHREKMIQWTAYPGTHERPAFPRFNGQH